MCSALRQKDNVHISIKIAVTEYVTSVTAHKDDRRNGRLYIQKFPDWLPEPRTTNDIALCHYVQLYRYVVSQCSEFCRHNTLLLNEQYQR